SISMCLSIVHCLSISTFFILYLHHVITGLYLRPFPTRRSSDLDLSSIIIRNLPFWAEFKRTPNIEVTLNPNLKEKINEIAEITRSEEHTSELQSRFDLVCRLLLEKKYYL